MNCVYLLTQASSSQRNTQLLLWQMSQPKHLPRHVCPWQTWHVDHDSSMGTMDLATFPLFSGSTIGFLQNGSVFVSVCATLKKPWREDWNIHREVMTSWVKSCCSRGWKMWASYFCHHNRPQSPLCRRATHVTPSYFSRTDCFFCNRSTVVNHPLKYKQRWAGWAFWNVLMDTCCSHLFIGRSMPRWSPGVFVVRIYSDYGCLVQSSPV